MKIMVLRVFSFFALALLTNVPAATAADTNPPPRLTVELRDGSRVVGTSEEKNFKFHSALLGDLKLAVKDIRSLDWAKTNSVRLTTANGDVLLVAFIDSEIGLETGFGKTKLPTSLIYSIRVSSSVNTRHGLKFNLSNRVEISNDPALQFGDSPFTISFWFKTASERPYLSFISKRANSLGDGWVVHADHGQLLFYCAGCASPKSQPVSIRDNEWHHLLVTRSGSLMTFYLDGKNVGAGETRCNHYDANPIRIGMDGDGNSWHFEGVLSEVHIYGRALNADDIQEEWNHGVARTQAVAGGGLIAGYHFDERQGRVAKDFSGNNHDGLLINNPEWEN